MGLFKKKDEPEMVEREDGLIDYDVYVMSKEEKLLNIIIAAVVIFAIGYMCYHNLILSAVLSLLALKWPPMRVKQIIKKRHNELAIQFKDMLYSLSSSLSAGKSVETGLKECLQDLKIIYPDDETYIIKEISYIVRGVEMNETIEDMFAQFAERAHNEDIENFVDIFKTCKRTGGDMVQVIKTTSQTIGEKIEIKQEINTMISGKKFEFKALMIMPVFLILLLSVSSADYMEPVFTTAIGHIVMTVAIFLFAIAYIVGDKIMTIEV
ncbi:MAG: type II secretion system F family protein [Clostridia bacterium]|nr:type II secretion system F family protein [Clostridia bacterium]